MTCINKINFKNNVINNFHVGFYFAFTIKCLWYYLQMNWSGSREVAKWLRLLPYMQPVRFQSLVPHKFPWPQQEKPLSTIGCGLKNRKPTRKQKTQMISSKISYHWKHSSPAPYLHLLTELVYLRLNSCNLASWIFSGESRLWGWKF